MTIESVTYISDFDNTLPAVSDSPQEGDNHIRNIKTGVLGSFPNFVGTAMTSTEAELNILDGATVTTAELNQLSGAGNLTFTASGTGGVERTFESKFDEMWSITDYGAATSETAANNTTYIQAAIDAVAAAGGGKLLVPNGTYSIAVQGTNAFLAAAGRNYGLEIKSGVYLVGEGSDVSILQASASTDMDVITTNRNTTTTDFGVIGLTVDGNEVNQTNGLFNLWIAKADSFFLQDVMSKNSGSWACRLEQVANSHVADYEADLTTESNADGLHMVDCTYMTLNNLLINTESDDGFAIEALNGDSHNISVSGIAVTCPTTVTNVGRGIALFLDDTVASGAHSIYNINIVGAAIYNTDGQAVSLQGDLFNVNIEAVTYDCYGGLNLVAGTTTYAGNIQQCKFDIQSYNPTTSGSSMTESNGVIDNNKIDLSVYNPGDGNVGATVKGTGWRGDVQVDYDPAGTKVSGSLGIDLHADYSDLGITVDGGTTATNGLVLRATATNNTLRLNHIINTATNALLTNVGSDNNSFIGGTLDDSVANSGSNNQFFGVAGGSSYGTAALTVAGDGTATIAHNLQAQPRFVNITILGDYALSLFVDAQSTDATNITARFKDSSGADVTSGTYNVHWEARL